MKLHDDSTCFIFPGYGSAFQNMMPHLAEWQRAFLGEHLFWHGFNGGGVLSVPDSLSPKSPGRVAPGHPMQNPYGMVLGNEAGKRVSESVWRVQEDPPPDFAVRMGLVDRVPDPTVKTTIEHVDMPNGERILLVVPKANRKNLNQIERLPEWFETFDVSVGTQSRDARGVLGDSIATWFGDPSRTMMAFGMSGGEDNAAWQAAVVCYVAEYWDTQISGLDSVHFLADIEGKPCFRKHWASNK